MKNQLQIFALLFFVTFLFSCGDDDEVATTHEMGNWTLESFIIANSPAVFSYQDGLTFGVSDITLGGTSINSYELELNKNSSFVRKLGVQNSVSQNDQGTWLLEDESLILTSDEDTGDEEFQIEKNELDQLWLSIEASFLLIRNDTIDALNVRYDNADDINSYLNGLPAEDYAAYFSPASVDIIFAFKRD
jgi:hypothetical protein